MIRLLYYLDLLSLSVIGNLSLMYMFVLKAKVWVCLLEVCNVICISNNGL